MQCLVQASQHSTLLTWGASEDFWDDSNGKHCKPSSPYRWWRDEQESLYYVLWKIMESSKICCFFFGRCSKDVGKFPCLRARNLGFVWFLVTIEFFHNKNLRAEFPSNLHLVARNFFGGFLSNPHWLATSQHPETAPIKKWHGQDGRLGRGMEVLGRDVCPELEAVPGFEAMMERWMTVEMKMLGETAWEWQFFVCYD